MPRRGTKGIGCESNPLKPNAAPPAPGSGAGSGTNGGGLPVTGVSGGTLAGVGLGAILLGVGGVVLVRRRRPQFTA